jgi:thiosulfate/3-mercaptopyruvate sulfurtransferase
MNAIISASELEQERAGQNPPVLLDVRWQLSTAKAAGAAPFDGRAEYAAGHLPGAVFVDLDRELASAPGGGGRHPLPDVAEFGAAMRRAGVTSGRPVVVYDGGQGWAAARAWWLLRWTGHPNVRVLDGGLPAWRGPLSTEVPAPEEGDFTPRPGAVGLLDAE